MSLRLAPESPETRGLPGGIAGDARVSLDTEKAAQLIDVVAGYRPTRLADQLALLWGSSFKEDARYVLSAALVCRDPLSHPDTVCTDALNTIAELNQLVRRWSPRSLGGILERPNRHACALLHVCDDRLARLSAAKQAPYKAIRESLEAAARHERKARGVEIRMIANLRNARCPEMWQLYERFRDME